MRLNALVVKEQTFCLLMFSVELQQYFGYYVRGKWVSKQLPASFP